LSVPVAIAIAFPTLKPVKWLRFLGYAMYGRIGDMYACPTGRPVNLAVHAGARYFIISQL
jgi:hypothetical protein